jgi:hypothetical protein
LNKEKEINDSNIRDFLIGLGLFVAVFGAWCLSWWFIDRCLYLDNTTEADAHRGQFGDKFGAINSLFSGLAFAGIIFTIFLQKRELSLQRQELKDTREELKRSANAQEKSQIALDMQAENMKTSAELTALNTLVNYYSEREQQIAKSMNKSSLTDVSEKKKMYLKRIELILALQNA